jgi:hypothetical protein
VILKGDEMRDERGFLKLIDVFRFLLLPFGRLLGQPKGGSKG